MTLKRRALTLTALTLLVAAVGYLAPSDWLGQPTDDPPPRVYLHRAGGAVWPENTLTAINNAIAWRDPAGRPVQGIEVDIELTADHVPIVFHDPWLSPETCRHTDGTPLTERIPLTEITAAALRADYRCGPPALTDQPAHREPIATLDDLIAALAAAPELAVFLDVKIDPPLTPGADAFAPAILTRWRAARLQNPLALEGPDPAALAAFRAAAGDHPVELYLSYPAFTAQNNWTLTGLFQRARVRLMPAAPTDDARAAGADAIMSMPDVITWHAARRARRAGLGVAMFFTAPRPDTARYCAWPVSALLVKHPADGRCGVGEGDERTVARQVR